MTKDNLITAPVGTTLEEAERTLHQHRIEKLPVVDRDFNLRGLITVKDIQKRIRYPRACKDHLGRLRVGAAIGVGADNVERADELVRAGVDVVVLDSAHGHSKSVLDTTRAVKQRHPTLQLIVGTWRRPTGARPDRGGGRRVKVGMGPGSACTTRVVAGVGVPQITAVMECAEVAAQNGVPIIADGGSSTRGRGERCGGRALGDDWQSPGRHRGEPGRNHSPGRRTYKVYRGMGSLSAASGGRGDRYFQEGVKDLKKLVAEGIEARVPYKGQVANRHLPAHGRPARRHGLLRRRLDRRSPHQDPLRPHHARRAPREPPARPHDHQGSPELRDSVGRAVAFSVPRRRPARVDPGVAPNATIAGAFLVAGDRVCRGACPPGVRRVGGGTEGHAGDRVASYGPPAGSEN